MKRVFWTAIVVFLAILPLSFVNAMDKPVSGENCAEYIYTKENGDEVYAGVYECTEVGNDWWVGHQVGENGTNFWVDMHWDEENQRMTPQGYGVNEGYSERLGVKPCLYGIISFFPDGVVEYKQVKDGRTTSAIYNPSPEWQAVAYIDPGFPLFAFTCIENPDEEQFPAELFQVMAANVDMSLTTPGYVMFDPSEVAQYDPEDKYRLFSLAFYWQEGVMRLWTVGKDGTYPFWVCDLPENLPAEKDNLDEVVFDVSTCEYNPDEILG